MKLADHEFESIRKTLHRLCGVTLGPEKQYLVTSRLNPVMVRLGVTSYAELIRRLESINSRDLREELVEAMTTKETSFNRDKHPFEELTRSILPWLVETQWQSRRIAGRVGARVRIWSAAASTGQEAYSVAMSILDYLRHESSLRPYRPTATPMPTVADFTILGTDVSPQALTFARAGVYRTFDIERGLSQTQRDRYFVRDGMNWQINSELRKMVEFRQLNLIEPIKDVGKFDLILCRNVLIYFDDSARHEIMRQLVASLHPGGLLMLGASESLPIQQTSAANLAAFGLAVYPHRFGQTYLYGTTPLEVQ